MLELSLFVLSASVIKNWCESEWLYPNFSSLFFEKQVFHGMEGSGRITIKKEPPRSWWSKSIFCGRANNLVELIKNHVHASLFQLGLRSSLESSIFSAAYLSQVIIIILHIYSLQLLSTIALLCRSAVPTFLETDCPLNCTYALFLGPCPPWNFLVANILIL